MAIDRVLQLLGALLAASLVRGLAVLGVAFGVTALVRQLSRESRHLAWFAALAVFLLIPLAWLVLPPLPVDGTIPVQPSSGYRLATAPVLSGSEYARLVDRSFEQATLAREAPAALRRGAPLALTAAWAVGVLAFAIRLMFGWLRVRRLAAGAGGSRRLQALADGISAGLRIRRRPRVLLAAGCRMPFTFGALRPAIVLPFSARRWSGGRVGSVLTHEAAHVARRDLLPQMVGYAACVLFWFVPPVWLAYAAMLREAEACCDQQVINRGYRGSVYARDIVDLVRSAAGSILLPGAHRRAGAEEHGTAARRDRPAPAARREAARAPRHGRGARREPVLPAAARGALGCGADRFGSRRTTPSSARGSTRRTSSRSRHCRRRTSSAPTTGATATTGSRIPNPTREFLNTFEDTWIDRAGNRWYKIRVITMVYPSGAGRKEGFNLARVDAAGSVMEMAYAEYGYPATLEPVMSPRYTIYYRQP